MLFLENDKALAYRFVSAYKKLEKYLLFYFWCSIVKSVNVKVNLHII